MKVILALDAGTTNVKAILVDRQAHLLAQSSVPLAIDFPQSGWVEQSAEAVWEEAIAFQVKDVFEAMEQAADVRLESLLADGGASKNDWLMQFQADVLDRPVLRSRTAELSGLGAAFAAGLGCGFWASIEEVAAVAASHEAFSPQLKEGERNRLVRRWNGAVASVKAYGLVP